MYPSDYYWFMSKIPKPISPYLIQQTDAFRNWFRKLRVMTGPGYRLYFSYRAETIVLLLCGGDKSSQQQDIANAKKLAGEMT